MQALTRKRIVTHEGEKTVSVHVCDIRELDVDVDIMTVSSFYRDYSPVKGTLFGALEDQNIHVPVLADTPAIDLRDACNIWLSGPLPEDAGLPVRRIGCIESAAFDGEPDFENRREAMFLSSIQAYFRMLDIASIMGIPAERIVLPVLGSGNQGMPVEFIAPPLLNECIRFLKNNRAAKHIMIVTRSQESAFRFGMALENSYSFREEVSAEKRQEAAGGEGELAFISYSSLDKNVADNLCAKLEARGIRVWYAPRNITAGDYAGAIVRAINSCTKFIVILSRNSLQSAHVLNEIDLAFSRVRDGVKFLPLKLDEEELGASFLYYLSRQHWMDAHVPTLEKRLEEFADFCMQ